MWDSTCCCFQWDTCLKLTTTAPWSCSYDIWKPPSLETKSWIPMPFLWDQPHRLQSYGLLSLTLDFTCFVLSLVLVSMVHSESPPYWLSLPYPTSRLILPPLLLFCPFQYWVIHIMPQFSFLWLRFLFRCFPLQWDSLPLTMTLHLSRNPSCFSTLNSQSICSTGPCASSPSLHVSYYNTLSLTLHFLCLSQRLKDYSPSVAPFISSSTPSCFSPFSGSLVKLFIGDWFTDLLCLIISIHF